MNDQPFSTEIRDAGVGNPDYFPTYPMRPINGDNFLHRINAERYDSHGAAEQWSFGPKFNGWRALVNDKAGTMFNRHGVRLSITELFEVREKLRGCGGVNPWWDTEALERRHAIGKGSLLLIDHLDPDRPFRHRQNMVTTWGEEFDWRTTPFAMEEGQLYAVPSFGYEEALRFWAEAPVINAMLGCTFYEGLVAKRVTSPYKFQLRSDNEPTMDWIKHRFTTLP